jgi:hypothetical protein
LKINYVFFSSENPKLRDSLEGLSVSGRIILKCDFKDDVDLMNLAQKRLQNTVIKG